MQEEPKPRGLIWLELIGREDLADIETSKMRPDGSVITMGHFDEICGPHVEGMFEGLATGVITGEEANRIKSILRQGADHYAASGQQVE